MELEGRAARRPMPRQMDVSDWSVDTDVRSGVSSALPAYQRERPALDTRYTPAEASRRFSSGEELRSEVRNILRPVNRYDSHTTTSETAPANISSSWRLGETTGRAAVSSYARLSERHLLERDPGAQRQQPRSMPVTRRVDDSYRPAAMGRGVDDLPSRIPVEGSEREEARRRDESSIITNRDEARRRTLDSGSFSADYSPPREQYRHATPPSTVRSDASTAYTSSPFTPSITDTPPSLARSLLTPPDTPFNDHTSTRQLSSESTSMFSNPSSTQQSPSSTDQSSAVSEDPESSSTRIEVASSRPSTTVDDRPASVRVPSATSPPSASISPRQQREQLYDFRRDIREVFARVDEMVDLHRDMFKCDVFSGIPEFNETVARETAEFASKTFEQLTQLRERFEGMTTAWARAAETPSDSDREAPPRRTRQVNGTESIRTADSSLEVMSISTGRSLPAAVDNQSGSSISSESPTASSYQDRQDSAILRSHWEPTLSHLSSDDDDDSSASSVSSAPASDACSSSLPSELPTLSRPSTATSSAVSSRGNVFEDFDKRMEEIRASLNAMSRAKPQPRPSPRAVSTRLSSGNAKPRPNDDDDEAHGENNARVGNRVAPPWHQQPAATGATTRHDREARLRQLLRELQTTGEQLDAAGDGG